MSKQYTADGKRRSSQTHANHSWTCDCGKRVWGNGGKSSHQRACRTWAEAELGRTEYMLAYYQPGGEMAHFTTAPELAAKYAAKRDELRERLGTAS